MGLFHKNKYAFPLSKRDGKWGSLSRKAKTILVVMSVLAVILIVVFLHYVHVHRYDSPEKLAAVYHRYESDFQSAQCTLCLLPKHFVQDEIHDDDRLKYYYSQTLITTRDDMDLLNSWTCSRQIEKLWICSCVPFTDEEYEAIYHAVWPLFRKTSMDMILVSPERDFVDFTLYLDSGKWSGFRDCIYYEASGNSMEPQEYIASYYRSMHFKTHCIGVPDGRGEIDSHWFCETTHEF